MIQSNSNLAVLRLYEGTAKNIFIYSTQNILNTVIDLITRDF